MKKIFNIFLLLILSLSLTGCFKQKQFSIALQPALFQGTSTINPNLKINLEFSNISTMEYVKTNQNKIKDLSTVSNGDKTYEAYHINLVLSEGNNNYVIEFDQAESINYSKINYYKLYNKRFDPLKITNMLFKLIDNDGDAIVDEFEVSYQLDGIKDTANLKLISKSSRGNSHGNYYFNCHLTYDENIVFEYEPKETFLAGTTLNYRISKIEGYKFVMYVNDKLYKEVMPTKMPFMDFNYVPGYNDVNIEFKAVKIE